MSDATARGDRKPEPFLFDLNKNFTALGFSQPRNHQISFVNVITWNSDLY